MKNFSDKKRIWKIAIAFLLIVVVLSTVALLYNSRKAMEKAVYELSEMYLSELSTQKAAQFSNAIDMRIHQLLVTVRDFERADVDSDTAIRSFLEEMQFLNGFDFFALTDDRGVVYTKNGTFTDASGFPFADPALTEPFVSFGQDTNHDDMVFISVPIDDLLFSDEHFVSATAGILSDNVAKKLELAEKTNKSVCSLITAEGDYIIGGDYAHISIRTNFLSDLEREGTFQNPTDLSRWKDDMAHGRAGIVVYQLRYVTHYIYYMPIENTDWFFTTTLHYDLVSKSVDSIRTTTTRSSVIQLILILFIIAVLFLTYLSMRRRNDRLWYEKIQAEESSKAKSTFLASMSHDIRTPMNAIIGFTNLAAKNVEDTEKTRDYLGKISASSEHLLALINDILEMSRIESGKIQLDEEPCNLSELLHSLSCIISGQAQSKHLELLMDAVDVENEDVYCDKLRMNQVFLNLLGNALKFTPAGGTISLRIEQTETAPAGCGAYVIRVKDTGIGMSEEYAKTIFEPFTRERTAQVNEIQGTGLGMSITKNIIDLMGGSIDVITAPGKGTEFIIRITLRLCPSATKPADFPQLSGKRALVAGGDDDSRAALMRMLTKLHLRAEESASGSDALRRARESAAGGDACGLYIIDRQLSDLGGIETARRIRELDAGAVIIIVSYDWAQTEEDAQRAGIDAFCSKPVFFSDLCAALQRACGQQGAPVPKQEDAAFDFTGKRILLTEDNELNREIAIEILSDAGFTVEEAENGAVAVEKLRTAAPGYYDLVLMDIQMPVMDGYTAARTIRAMEDSPVSSIPIIAMTANAFEEDRRLALEAGMNGHVVKPLDVPTLLRVLTEIIKS